MNTALFRISRNPHPFYASELLWSYPHGFRIYPHHWLKAFVVHDFQGFPVSCFDDWLEIPGDLF